MKKALFTVVTCMILLAVGSTSTFALCEIDYVSINEIQKTLPERWTGDYVLKKGAHKQLKKGDTVSVDVPIVVPEVDTVPAVRITWEPPVEGLDESLNIDRNTWSIKKIGRDFSMAELSMPLLENNTTFDPMLPWEDAPAIAIDEFQKWMPFMRDKEFTCYFQRSHGSSEDNGFQRLYFYTTYHGIPYLLGGEIYLHEVESEYGSHAEEKIAVPATEVAMFIKQPGQFWSDIYDSKEVGVDAEDIPLLPFEEIMKVLEQRVIDGYAYSLDEVRFGYMGFIDPEKKGEEFVLLPIWTAKGRTRNDLTIPFDLKTEQVVKDYQGYSSSAIVVNAQTGETYDFANDARPDRRYVPHVITWDEVK
ncbi:MAG: hypothetical protein RR696_15235, partial [Clostridia bacterium]